MSRKKLVIRKRHFVEPIYKNPVVAKFITRMMIRGKMSTSANIFYKAMDLIKEKTNQDPVEVFTKAMDNIKPMLEVKSRRVGGSTYQVPVEIREDRREALAMRWIIEYSRERSARSMSEKLCNELIDAMNSTGNSFKKKEDTHRMAEANKAFAHYRW
ncbi:MAG: 30S ribosomal protein S7 [Spirochaetaceae bacterium]|nr:MAG: 30S ribosomal protein S7 [Spirochaetaceae bacterium]